MVTGRSRRDDTRAFSIPTFTIIPRKKRAVPADRASAGLQSSATTTGVRSGEIGRELRETMSIRERLSGCLQEKRRRGRSVYRHQLCLRLVSQTGAVPATVRRLDLFAAESRHCGRNGNGAQNLPFKAHAWTEVHGRAVNERRDVQRTYRIWNRC